MARNKVQFQKGLSEAQFAVLYGTEDQCREAVMRWRWPSGFVCPVCAGEHHSFVKTRALYQCTACRRQTSVIAGTIFAATKVPLCTWFRAMYHLTQSKGGISSIELGRRLGVTQTTAWKIKQKHMKAMMERDATKRRTGRIEIGALAQREGVSRSYFTRLVRLSYLAPDITQAILDGRQPRDLTAEKLLDHSRLPLAWHDQRIVLGFG